MWRQSLIFLSIILLAESSALLGGSLQFQDLAIKFTPSAYQKVDLDKITNQSLPGDLGSLRKSILLIRTYLDIFVYVYPIGNPDLFEILRGDLDKLYVSLGNFDDEQHWNYTTSDKDKLLSKCLKYKYRFQQDDDKYNFYSFIQQTSDKLYYRNKDELSVDFWGNISQVPNNSLTGYQNIGLLSQGQLQNIISTYEYVTSIDEIWKSKNHHLFHDYRKSIRGAVFIPNFFPDVYSKDVSKYADIIDSAYSKLGKINDQITEYQYYEKKGYLGEANKKEKEIILMWKSLRDWLNSDFIMSVKDILNSIN